MAVMNDAQSAPAAPGKLLRRLRGPDQRPRGKRQPTPSVLEVMADGEKAVAVSLSGGLGRGRMMLLNPDDWAWTAENVGTCWIVLEIGKVSYVGSTETRAARLTGQAGSKPKAFLARLLVGRDEPLAGQAVAYRNGDRLDLRRSNLRVIPQHLRLDFRPDQKPPVVTPGWT